MSAVGVQFRNGEAIERQAIPTLDAQAFANAVLAAVEQGERIMSLFGQPLPSGDARLYVVLGDDTQHTLSVVATQVKGSYPSLTPHCAQAHLFEREIHEQLGVMPEGHPWLKPVRKHYFGNGNGAETQKYRYFSMGGEEVHEVAVGPVHAGVIEPGHFRFQCQGEVVHHLEIHLGYQHRGIEEALVGGPHKRTMLHMETVAGDTSIGHGTSYCLAVEALAGGEAPPRAQAVRAVALELERLANHVGDIGALANDVAFLPTAAYCGRLRGDFLNMTALICGSRLGRGLVRPGGVVFDIGEDMAKELLRRLAVAEQDVHRAVELFFATRSVLGRLEGTGAVSSEACRDLGIVGLAARASGCHRDARTGHPSGWYKAAPIPMAVEASGDVLARAKVRWQEVQRSIAFVREQLLLLPESPTYVACLPPAPNRFVVAVTEGWRGEVVHVAMTDEQGRFARYKITDPSFHNWMALALALRGQQISDFPLCNKSFNLSYCGFDL